MERVYLSKRNLLALLAKLERVEKGEHSFCTIINFQNPGADYDQTMDTVAITAVPDEEYYKTQPKGVIFEEVVHLG